MELLSPIVELLAIGAIAGYFVGYLIKKLLHLAVIIGVFAFLFMYMSYEGAIDLKFEELSATITRFTDALSGTGFTSLVSSSPFTVSFCVGLFLGFRRG